MYLPGGVPGPRGHLVWGCTCLGGIPGSGGVPGPWGCTWSWGYLVGGCTCLGLGVSGLGVYLVLLGEGVYLVQGVYLVPGGCT